MRWIGKHSHFISIYLVNINDTYSIIIGGESNYCENAVCASTYYYNHEAEQWIEGPNLIQGRRYHAAGVLFDKYTLQKIVIVTGGGNRKDGNTDTLFDSTEMLIANQWVSGKN